MLSATFISDFYHTLNTICFKLSLKLCMMLAVLDSYGLIRMKYVDVMWVSECSFVEVLVHSGCHPELVSTWLYLLEQWVDTIIDLARM